MGGWSRDAEDDGPAAVGEPNAVLLDGLDPVAVDNTTHVDLDLRHLDGAHVRERFPTIARATATRCC